MFSDGASNSAASRSTGPAAAKGVAVSAPHGPGPHATPPIASAARPLPPGCDLPTDSFLLARVSACDTDPITLSEELGIRLELLIDWMTAPETVKRLNAMIEYREMIAQQKQKALAARVLESFEKLYERAQKNDDPIEQRRTGIAILRYTRSGDRRTRFGLIAGATRSRAGGALTQSSEHGALTLSRFPMQYRTRSRIIRTVPVLHEPPAILPPPEQPDPAQSPAATTFKVLHRLQDSDNPCEGDGLRTLYNHFTDRFRTELGVDSAEDFARTDLDAYHALLAHHSAILHPTLFCRPAYEGAPVLGATQHADLIDLDGNLWTLTLSFCRRGSREPWLIDDLQLDPPAAADAAPETS